MRKVDSYIPIIRGVQIAEVKLESQGDCHNEETVRFENGESFITACDQSPTDRSGGMQGDSGAGILRTPPQPVCLE